jgi:Protein of Unknown function (DUF2784)
VPYRALADGVVCLHLLWIVFLFIGGLWGRRLKAVRIFHVSGLAFALVIQIFDWYCPLTHLEVWLRSNDQPQLGYGGSFIIHYVEKLVYLQVSPDVVLFCTIVLIAVNAWWYLRR